MLKRKTHFSNFSDEDMFPNLRHKHFFDFTEIETKYSKTIYTLRKINYPNIGQMEVKPLSTSKSSSSLSISAACRTHPRISADTVETGVGCPVSGRDGCGRTCAWWHRVDKYRSLGPLSSDLTSPGRCVPCASLKEMIELVSSEIRLNVYS